MADELPPDDEVPDGAAVLPELPAELGTNPVLLALLHCVVFLQGSDPEVVNPAAADEALGRIADYLQRLSEKDLDQVQEDLKVLTAYARQEKWPKVQVQFFKQFLADFGVTDEGELDDV